MIIHQTIKVKIYTNKKQQQLLRQYLGNVRFIWNKLLEIQEERLKNREKLLNYYELCKEITKLRQEFGFLKLSPAQTLQQIAKKLDNSIKQWRKKQQKFPKFKKKKNFDGVLIFPQGFRIEGKYLFLPKIRKVKIKDKINKKEKWKEISNNLKQVWLKEEATGFYAYLVYETETKHPPLNQNKVIGIDVGIRNTITLSNGEIFKIDKKRIEKIVKKIEKLQSVIDKKKHINDLRGIKYSKSLEKVILKQKKLFEKLRNIKEDYYHKVTAYIVKSHDYIGVENLNLNEFHIKEIKDDKKVNKRFHKLLNFTSLSKFFEKLEHKAKFYGKVLVKVNPKNTSKICSNCGFINENLRDEEVFKCPNCGFKINRDVNASINILKRTIELMTAGTQRDKGAEMVVV